MSCKRFLWLGGLTALFTILSLMACIPKEERAKGPKIVRPTPQAVDDFQEQRNYAILVGVGRYADGAMTPLNYTVKDIKALGEVLKDQGYTVYSLTDDRATKGNILAKFRLLENSQANPGTLIFAFSGHGFGAADGGNYLADYGTNASVIAETGLKVARVAQAMRDSGAKRRLMLLDACRVQSGAMGGGRGFHDQDAEGLHILQSTAPGQLSWEDPALEHSVFTHFLIAGLRGESDERGHTAMRADGSITMASLKDYLTERMRDYSAKTDREQLPYYSSRDTIGDPLIAQLESPEELAAPPEPPPVVEAEPLSDPTPATPPPVPAYGELRLTVQPPKAKVYLDNEYQGQGSLRLKNLPVGEVLTVEARLAGHETRQERVRIRAEAEQSLRLNLPAIDTRATLSLTSEPSGARWYLDGALMGTTPEEGVRIAAGRHVIEVKAEGEGYEDWRRELRLAEQGRERLRAALTPLAPSDPARYTEQNTGLEFVRIEKGCFQMGSPESETGRDDDERRHRVCIEEDYYMGTTEVTRGAFARFVEATGYETEAESGDGCWIWTGSAFEMESGRSWRDPGFDQGSTEPAVCVSWNDAVAYAEWLSEETGKDYRLPTEAEWEYAARAGTDTRYWWGDQDPVCQAGARNGAKFDDDQGCDDTGTEPVGTYQANPWGLYEVHGNVWEWTCSAYAENYDGSEMRCQTSGGARRVDRGGSWNLAPRRLRAANRYHDSPAYRYGYLGFRLARAL